jgi:hypothetical protein
MVGITQIPFGNLTMGYHGISTVHHLHPFTIFPEPSLFSGTKDTFHYHPLPFAGAVHQIPSLDQADRHGKRNEVPTEDQARRNEPPEEFFREEIWQSYGGYISKVAVPLWIDMDR